MRIMLPEDYALQALNIKWQRADIISAMRDVGLEMNDENLEKMYDEVINLRGTIRQFVNKKLRDIARDIKNEHNSGS